MLVFLGTASYIFFFMAVITSKNTYYMDLLQLSVFISGNKCACELNVSYILHVKLQFYVVCRKFCVRIPHFSVHQDPFL